AQCSRFAPKAFGRCRLRGCCAPIGWKLLFGEATVARIFRLGTPRVKQKIPKEEDNRRGKVTKPNKYGDLAVSGFPFAREAQAGCNAPGERCERIAVGNSARFWLNRDIELFRREVL